MVTSLAFSNVVFADESIIDLGVVHYSQAPKTWTFEVPDNIEKVEVGIYGKGQTQINKYAGWNGSMKLNGAYLWKMTGLDSSGVAIIEDYVLGATMQELSGRNKWQDITTVVRSGENTLTYYHYTDGDGAGVKIRMTTKAGITESTEVSEITSQTGYDIQIISVDLRYFETIFNGRLTHENRGVSNVQLGIEDPLKKMSLMGPMTDENGFFTYTTNPHTEYRSAEAFLFAYQDAQTPYVIAERFTSYELVVKNLDDNDVYSALSDSRKENIQIYQKIENELMNQGTLSVYETAVARNDLMDIMLDDALAEKVSAGMELVDWAGSVGMCAKGIVASGPTAGASVVGCAPLGVKLVNEGVDVSTDILVDKGYITGETAKLIDETSNTATSCISITDPIDTASCLGAVVSGGLHIVSYELENNDYGQPAVVVKLSKTVSGAVDYALVIVNVLN